MSSERFFCNRCKKFFKTPNYYFENHGLDEPPYERVPICSRCGSNDFVMHKCFVEKIDIAERMLAAVMYLNKYWNALKDIYGLSFKNDELTNSIEILTEAVIEMYEFLDSKQQIKIFNICSEDELQRILIDLKG